MLTPLKLATLCLLSCAFAAQATAEAPRPLRVLLLSGKNNHDWKSTTPALKAIYEESGRFVVDVTEKPEECTAETFAKYDAIVSDWAGFPDMDARQWGPDTEKAFVDFIQSGKGFVLFHAASASFHTWPEFQQISGSTWGKDTGHGAYHTFPVHIVDTEHPVTRGLKDFTTTDELWHRTQKHPDIHVLATAHSAQERGGSGADEPVAIVTHLGQGRGFNLILGHDVPAMRNPGWQTLMLRGTEWAATGKVTIEPVLADCEWSETTTTLALKKSGKVVWQLNYDKGDGKPYFHPLSLTDGTTLTWFRPPDHVWHRGIWFSWKYINGVNYWEYDAKTGKEEGVSELLSVKATPRDDFSARFEIEIGYHPPEKPAVLTEKRIVEVGAPDAAGRYQVDWHSVFTAGGEPVHLTRTPIPGEEGGVGWGGYAGLSVRLIKSPSEWRILDSEGRTGDAVHGNPARWTLYSSETPEGPTGSIALLDHPQNPRHPTRWYAMRGGMVYFSPAPLFGEGMQLAAGETLDLRYRILIRPGASAAEEIDEAWRAFQ